MPVTVSLLPRLTVRRLPAECRGNTGEADDAEPESLDSGPQVLLNLPWIVFG